MGNLRIGVGKIVRKASRAVESYQNMLQNRDDSCQKLVRSYNPIPNILDRYPSFFVILMPVTNFSRCNKILEIGQCRRLTKEFNGEVMEFSKD